MSDQPGHSIRSAQSALRAAAMIVSWMTILPLRVAGPVDRAAASRALSFLPVAGLVLGAAAALAAWLLTAVGASPFLSGALIVAGLAALTRGMHLDGFADTVDGLASYRDPATAREIMRSGPVGPLGAGALALLAIVEVAAYAQLVAAGAFLSIGAVGLLSRCLPVWLCRRGLPGAESGGFGPLVSTSQGPLALTASAAIALGSAVIAGLDIAASDTARWAGSPDSGAGASAAVAVVASVVICVALFGLTQLLGRHSVRRLGGISGDVLGAGIALGAGLCAAAFAVVTG
ncbi:adenosylcobinamide-GDP ribazoletransferase [Dietzia sp.]|uniref:adenosylcobinamide-GDP ribazoletransferase n=1 Tax=Dietzia sp. TaxID=1871616 RepID=UPI002FD90BBC